ncbi:MAG TPA: hypothetical protein VK886_05660 [Vicinamibacterales bacterium]|nr:hypothetical protein [Vicinamibacterales bacterium]
MAELALVRGASVRPHPDEPRLDEVVTLLAGLEHERARLAERRHEPGAVAPVVALGAIVNAIIGFVTERCCDPGVLPSRVLARLADEQPYTQILGEEDERVTVSTAVAILEGWTGPDEDRRRMLQDLCRALIDVLVAYGNTLSSLFHSPRDRDEWRSTFDLFVADLRTAVQQMAV